jgi:hypothetical protein
MHRYRRLRIHRLAHRRDHVDEPGHTWPIDPGDPDDEETELGKLPWAKAELSESWWSVIYGYTDEEWTAFDPEAVEDPDPPQRSIGPARVVPLRPRRGVGRR